MPKNNTALSESLSTAAANASPATDSGLLTDLSMGTHESGSPSEARTGRKSVSSMLSGFLYRNRWTILWSVVAAFVGALLPFAGFPALAVYLIPMVPAIASLSLVAMAAINAALFLSGVVVLGALIAGLNMLFGALQGNEKLNHPSANNLFDYVLISVGKAIINTVGFVRYVVKALSGAFDRVLNMALGNKFWTAAGLFVIGLFFASTFTTIGGPVALLFGSSLVVAPVVSFLLNGLIGLGLVSLIGFVVALTDYFGRYAAPEVSADADLAPLDRPPVSSPGCFSSLLSRIPCIGFSASTAVTTDTDNNTEEETGHSASASNS